jgi:Na+-translocating ferredoxin:NAD+ oxidoreductase subunit C
MPDEPINPRPSNPLPAPVARGLSDWPAGPPPFDSVDVDAGAGGSRESNDVAPIEDVVQLIDRLASCGVSAARHDSPDLLAQVHVALKRPIDSVICSVLDLDPAACGQSAWAAQHADDLVAGVSAVARVCRATRRIIVLDERAPSRWFSTLRMTARAAQPGVKVIELENDYPQADPTLLLYTMLNRRLRPHRSPAELGTIVLDAAAASAVGACVRRNQPMKSIPLVLRDHDRGETYFIHAPVGITCGQLLDHLGLLNVGDEQPESAPILRSGDVLRDQRITLDTKLGAGELLVHLSTQPKSLNPDPCIRCGWCLEACPTRIQPATLLEAAQHEDMDLADRAGLGSCIECGICQYVCPSRLPLLHGIRALRRAQDASDATTTPTPNRTEGAA